MILSHSVIWYLVLFIKSTWRLDLCVVEILLLLHYSALYGCFGFQLNYSGKKTHTHHWPLFFLVEVMFLVSTDCVTKLTSKEKEHGSIENYTVFILLWLILVYFFGLCLACSHSKTPLPAMVIFTPPLLQFSVSSSVTRFVSE